MSVWIEDVEQGSLARKAGVRPGETLFAVNGHMVEDVLDYRFYIVNEKLELTVGPSQDETRRVLIRKPEYEDPGLQFETYLMDKKRTCRNNCIFCFIDQMPEGMRESLYFKDDDSRLSFLMGNYITLTNLSEREIERILAMHISPMNISVHTTNPELRVRMMGNRFAGDSLSALRRFAEHHIGMNCQIVLCRGYNDGTELDRTVRDLAALYPAVASIAVVPVGLTSCREGLPSLASYDAAACAEVLGRLEPFQEEYLERFGTRLVFAADEFYLNAGRELPDADFYENFSQLENGVGMTALFESEFSAALEEESGRRLKQPRTVSVATGMLIAPRMKILAQKAQNNIAGLRCMVYPIENRLFGPGVTVSGLVTGRDLIDELRGRALGNALLISASMLRAERDVFLDDVSVADVREALGVPVTPVETDGAALLQEMLGGAPEESE